MKNAKLENHFSSFLPTLQDDRRCLGGIQNCHEHRHYSSQPVGMAGGHDCDGNTQIGHEFHKKPLKNTIGVCVCACVLGRAVAVGGVLID